MDFSLASLPPNCKILVIKLRSIGDVVLNTPVLENLKLNFPQCHLTVLVESPCDAVLVGNPFVDETLVRKRSRKSFGKNLSSLVEDIKFFFYIHGKKFDLVLDFHGGPRAANIALLSGARWKMGHQNSPRRWAYNLLVNTPKPRARLHTVKEQLAKLSFLGFETKDTNPRIWVSEEEKRAMGSLLKNEGLSRGTPFAVIHPGVLKPHLRWSPEKMAIVADHIQTGLGIRAVFVSMPVQLPQVEEIVRLMKSRPVSLAGKTDVRQLITLLSEARFLVCHNGGQMHLSAAVGTPVFALFGASSPEVFGPVGENHRVFYKSLPCNPCAPKPKFQSCLKGEPECKAKIEAVEIIEAIDELVGG